ncbi:MAG: type IV pilus secretin PilQ [Deltaproteobacteria bacterium]|nr:type IV pilus secretin PilQ [Deltaproteobacteria bacterium]
MKRAIRWKWLVFLAAIMTAALPPAWGAAPAAPDAAAETVAAGYLENVTFERLPGRERVTLTVSKQSGVTVESQPGNVVAVRMENLFVPEGLRHPLGDPALANVLRVTPVQKTADGRSWVLAAIELKQKAPYSVRQEGMNVLIEFNVSSLASAAAPAPEKPLPAAQPPAAPQTQPPAAQPAAPGKQAAGDAGKEKKAARISIDIQNALIESVFRLLSEQGGVSIVYDDDVKKTGPLTLNLRDVTWEEALDIILKMKNYEKIKKDNVITVMTAENLAKQQILERNRRDVEPQVTKVISVNYASAAGLKENLQEFLKDKDGKLRGSVRVDEHSNSLIIQALPDDIRRIIPIIEKIDKPTSQIQIKANIVETTKDMARSLGIQWGGVLGRNIGDYGMYVTPGGVGGSTTPPGSALAGSYAPAYGSPGVGGQGMGVNFPASGMTASASGTLGLIFGTIGGNMLELQLSALQKDNKLNILSSPSITTMDNQLAYTENGLKVPYVTTETSGGSTTRTVKFETVVLRLEITPHVIDGKNMKMKILVSKDEVDTTRVVEGNPFIIKKKTETNLIVQDGETIVISGLTKQSNTLGDTGIPLFKDVPILGWLFKSETKNTGMEEVLIFITPSIMKPSAVAGIQDGPGGGGNPPSPTRQ